MAEWKPCVYIMASKCNGTLYVGVTTNIARRVWEHKERKAEGFTRKYHVDKLVYCESCDSIEAAIHRETCIKEWKRIWKIRLIEESNPDWKDLYDLTHI